MAERSERTYARADVETPFRRLILEVNEGREALGRDDHSIVQALPSSWFSLKLAVPVREGTYSSRTSRSKDDG